MMLNKSIDKRDQYKIISISKLVPNNHWLHKVDAILVLYFVFELVENKYWLDNDKTINRSNCFSDNIAYSKTICYQINEPNN